MPFSGQSKTRQARQGDRLLAPGLDNTRLFKRMTAGAGTKCMSLSSSSPNLDSCIEDPLKEEARTRENFFLSLCLALAFPSSTISLKEERETRSLDRFPFALLIIKLMLDKDIKSMVIRRAEA